MTSRRTKIITTLGPATASEERIAALIRAGADTVRLNFSHGTQEEHGRAIATVREVATRLNRPVAILQDLQGPKIRTGLLEDGGPVTLEQGTEITITTQPIVGNAQRISTTYEALATDVKPGDSLLLDDGKIRLQTLSTNGEELLARVEHGGQLGQHKGINLPGVAVSAPSLTPKDMSDLQYGIAQNVDYVALSFVRTADEVERARHVIESHGGRVPLIVKLEKPQAIENLDSILQAADGVMVARGDLGVELPPEQVPMIQKRVIQKANRASKLVITATQMLESMVSQPTPTRAEATDVANAVWDGTDAVMLSAESAIGQFPIESVQVMARIVTEAEKQLPPVEPHGGRLSNAHAISHAARTLTEQLDVQAIVCFTRTGRTAQLLSQDRPRVPILAFTSVLSVYHRLSLWWGVTPFLCPDPHNTEALISYIERLLPELGLAELGQNVVIVGAIPHRIGVHTNFLKLHRLS